MQILFDAGFVSICLAHGRRMGMLRWDLTRYPTSPVTQHVLKKYLNFGEFVVDKFEQVGKSVASNKSVQDMKRKMK